jgi:hypothetical protein
MLFGLQTNPEEQIFDRNAIVIGPKIWFRSNRDFKLFLNKYIPKLYLFWKLPMFYFSKNLFQIFVLKWPLITLHTVKWHQQTFSFTNLGRLPTNASNSRASTSANRKEKSGLENGTSDFWCVRSLCFLLKQFQRYLCWKNLRRRSRNFSHRPAF